MGKMKLSKEAKDKIRKFGNKVAAESVKLATKDLLNAYSDAVDVFYASYEPEQYLRHGNPYSHSGGLYESIKKVYYNHGKKVYGGVVVSLKNMPSDYSGKKRFVFHSAYHGFHGPEFMGIYRTPEINQLMEKQFLYMSLYKQDYIKTAIQNVLKEEK